MAAQMTTKSIARLAYINSLRQGSTEESVTLPARAGGQAGVGDAEANGIELP